MYHKPHQQRRSMAFQRTDPQPEIPVEPVRRTHGAYSCDFGHTGRPHVSNSTGSTAGASCFFDCDPELVRTELRHRLCVPFFPEGHAVHLVRPSPRPSLRPRSGLPTRRGPQTPPTSSTNQPKKRFSTHREKAGLSSAHEPRPLSTRRTRPQKPGIMRTPLAVAKHPENRGPLPAQRHLLHCRGFRRSRWRMKRLRPNFGLLEPPTTQLHLSPRSQ